MSEAIRKIRDTSNLLKVQEKSCTQCAIGFYFPFQRLKNWHITITNYGVISYFWHAVENYCNGSKSCQTFTSVFRKYLPALKKYPAKYIYEPWKAPLTVQQAAGCLIGKDYPKPIVDHTKVVKVNLAKMKDAREKQYAGSSKQGLYFTPIVSSFIYFERVLVEQCNIGVFLLCVTV